MNLEAFFKKFNINDFNLNGEQALEKLGITEDDVYDLACENSYFLDEIFFEYHPSHIKSISKNLTIDEVLWFDKKDDEEPSTISQNFEWDFPGCEKVKSVISLFMQEKITTFVGLVAYLKKIAGDNEIKLCLSYGYEEGLEFFINKEVKHTEILFDKLGEYECLFLYQLLLLNKTEKITDIINTFGS